MIYLSIIIPAFNVEKYLKPCLDSIVNIKPNHIEVIVVNDGSTDKTGLIANEYAEQHAFIEVLHQSNHGVSAARNKALLKAVGNYIAFIDADDFIYREFFYQILRLIEFEPEIIEFNADLVNELGHIIQKKIFSLEQFSNLYKNTYQAKLRVSKQAKYYLWTRVFKRSLIKNLRFETNTDFCEDAVFLTEAYSNANKIITLDVSLYGYRQHSTNTTKIKFERNIKQLAWICSFIISKLQNKLKKQENLDDDLALLINMVHLRKSMRTLEYSRVDCDAITQKHIGKIKEYNSLIKFAIQGRVSWLRAASILLPRITNLFILIKSGLSNNKNQ